MALTITLLALSGCSLLSSPATIPAMATAIEAVAHIVKERTGKDLEDLPATTEMEQDPETGRILVLTTVCYKLQPGEVCQ